MASDLSEDIPNLFKDVGKNAEKVRLDFYAFCSSLCTLYLRMQRTTW